MYQYLESERENQATDGGELHTTPVFFFFFLRKISSIKRLFKKLHTTGL